MPAKKTREVATYQLVEGNSTIPPDGPGTEEQTFKEGDKVDTAMPLDEMWPAKWVKVGSEEEAARAPRKGAKAAKAPRAAAKAPPPEAEAEEEDVDLEGDDVTDDFDLAKDNDLKVMHVTGTGYTIYDGKNAINNEPVRTKTQATARLKDYVGDKE